MKCIIYDEAEGFERKPTYYEKKTLELFKQWHEENKRRLQNPLSKY